MPSRSSLLISSAARRVLAAFLLFLPATLFVAPANGETVAVAEEVSRGVVDNLIAQGQRLESQDLWADALSHYERALRQYPGQRDLQRRFDIARLHYGVEMRLEDRSYLQANSTLGQVDAFDLLAEMLLKIDTHYVASPGWDKIAQNGIETLDIALHSEEFQTRNGLKYNERQFAYLRSELRGLLKQPISTRQQVMSVARNAANLAYRRVGLRPTTVALEFTASTANSLDHYSAFLSGAELKEIFSQIEGNFVGLGVELKPVDGLLNIVHVIPGSPAEKSGLLAGDTIVAIDGRECSNMTTAESDSMLTGEEGSVVRITVADIEGQRRSTDVRRAHVDVPSLEGSKIVERESGIAYVKIPVFQKTTAADLEKALWDLHSQGMRSLIIDLRGNPGGLLTASVELADKFVAQGRIVSTRGRSAGEDFDYQAHRAGTWRVPLVVLIDENSASASEIFAAAIRDNQRGVLVGEKSYGKGSVQGIFPLSHAGIGVRLTTAKFYSPLSQPISKVGVQPDIVVRQANGQAEGLQIVGFRGETTNVARDVVLDKAIETARGQVAMR